MALSMLRHGLQTGRWLAPVVRLTPIASGLESRRGITHRRFRKPPKLPPYPYETHKWTHFDALFEDTIDRIDENSKIIVVEGNICSGKSTLAKKLAEELDFYHFPEADIDWTFVHPTGFDLRSVEDKLPESLKPFDMNRFYKNPTNRLTPHQRYTILGIRLEQYCDALAHMLNTGQGIILERSIFSDFVFIETLRKFKYINQEDYDVYKEMQFACAFETIYPHLVIYLDCPPEILMDRIQKRGLPHEVNNPQTLNLEYLKAIDHFYKHQFIPHNKSICEMLCYDCSEFIDPEYVMEDIERLDLEKILNDKTDERMMQWKELNKRAWCEMRLRYTNDKRQVIVDCIQSINRFNHPELVVHVDDIVKYNEVWQEYGPTYDEPEFEHQKDTSHFWRSSVNYRDAQRYYWRVR